jgi:multidrug transporter EmrE-like cation transporter
MQQALTWISAVGLLESIGLYLIRTKVFENQVAAAALYGLGVVPLLSKAVAFEGIGIVNFLWNIISTLTGFCIGIYLFNEKVHALQVAGVAISLLGIGLIFMAPKAQK